MAINVVGDIMFDHWRYTEASKLSAEAPVIVTRQLRDTWSPGGAANVAAYLGQRLPGEVTLFGIVHDDDFPLLDEITPSVNLYVQTSNVRVPIKERIVAGTQQLVRIDMETEFDFEESEGVCEDLWSQPASVTVVSDYGKGTCRRITLPAYSFNIVNAKPESFERWRDAEIITLNQSEAQQLLGAEIHNTDVCAQRFARITGNRTTVVVTMGADGALVFSPWETYHVPAIADGGPHTCGAGDIFVGAMACHIHEAKRAIEFKHHRAIKEAVHEGCLRAGRATQRPGTGFSQ